MKNSLSTEIVSFLNYIRVYVRGNFLASALNTNLVLGTYFYRNQYAVYQLQTQFTPDTTIFIRTTETMLCGTQNPISPATFSSKSGVQGIFTFSVWSQPSANSTVADGFLSACTPLEAVLRSTLDCLYDIQCIQLLMHYFPALNRVRRAQYHCLIFSLTVSSWISIGLTRFYRQNSEISLYTITYKVYSQKNGQQSSIIQNTLINVLHLHVRTRQHIKEIYLMHSPYSSVYTVVSSFYSV